MAPPVISIILPTYNDKAYLPAALESITSQSYGNFELIIIDDGSSDGGCNLSRIREQGPPSTLFLTTQPRRK
ncbi:glycosyltransferase family 2 protein [Pseudogulbenkiania subflava]|uniref:glycosyltransferase family 2 protein n=1 Tax=Pseudogulbenkiania subflava TaxID=451637 RepID=UPI003899D64B